MSHLNTLATGLLQVFEAEYRFTKEKRPGLAKVEYARISGMCDAAYRLGIGMTPFQVYLATRDSYQENPDLGTDDSKQRTVRQKNRVSALAERLRSMQVARFLTPEEN